MLVLLVLLSQFMLTIPMELGKGGVYDSPLATDELVREFGFLFGGGRSGVKGIEAFQVSFIVGLDKSPTGFWDAPISSEFVVFLEP